MPFNGGAPAETPADREVRELAAQSLPERSPEMQAAIDERMRLIASAGGAPVDENGSIAQEQPKNPLDPKNWEGQYNAEAAGPPPVQQTPMYRVPAGFHPGTESWRYSPGLSDEAVAPAVEAQKQYVSHADRAANAELQAAEMKAKNDAYYNVEKLKAEQQYAQEHAALEAKKQMFRDEAMADLQKRSEAVANAKVDPSAFWGEGAQGGLARVLGAIAVGMGQYSSSRIGGPNTALNIINSAIDRNIAAQRDNIDNQKAGLQAKNSLYAQNLAAFGDRESALLATKNNYLEQAKAFANQQAALNEGNLKAIGAAERLKADVSRIQADNALKIAQIQETKTETAGNRVWSPGGLVGGPVGAKQESDSFVPTLGGYVPGGKADASLLNKQGARVMEITANLKEAAALQLEAMTVPNYTPSGRLRLTQIEKQLKDLYADTATKRTVAEEQGAMSKGDLDVAMSALGASSKIVGNPDFNIKRNIENIRIAHDRALQNWRLVGEAYGIRRGGEAYVKNAQGQVVPTPVLQGKSRLPSHQTTDIRDHLKRPGQ